MSDYLFVYGTLLPGRVPRKIAPLAAKLRPVGEGFVRGVLYDLGRYPGAVPDPESKHRIAGTVMQLLDDTNLLSELDAYEGYNPNAPEKSEYIREKQSVMLATGETIECWFYRYNREPDASRIIASGAWER
ncbi:MAG: gamma-glutamylcyclotransferase family protein [Terracidiphilus sp.]